MFFIVSKILDFLINPVVWIGALLLLALITKKSNRRKNYLITSFGVVFLFGNSSIIDEIYRAWEIPAVELKAHEQYEYGIVLNGMMVWDSEFQRANFHGNVDRLLQALPLYHQNNVKKLLISGGDGTAMQDSEKEALVIKKYLNSIGFPNERIFFESDSRNTYENAKFSTEYLQDSLSYQSSTDKTLLITSALHMRRSLACFEKQGVHCDPYVTNRLSGPRKFNLEHLLVPKAASYNAWKAFLHELLGFVIYTAADYI